MVQTGAGTNNIFMMLNQAKIEDIHHHTHEYVGLLGIGNVGSNLLTNSLVALDLLNLSSSAQEVRNFYDFCALKYDS